MYDKIKMDFCRNIHRKRPLNFIPAFISLWLYWIGVGIDIETDLERVSVTIVMSVQYYYQSISIWTIRSLPLLTRDTICAMMAAVAALMVLKDDISENTKIQWDIIYMCNILVWHKGVLVPNWWRLPNGSPAFDLCPAWIIVSNYYFKNISIHFDYATLSIRLEMINVDPDNVSLHNGTRLYK